MYHLYIAICPALQNAIKVGVSEYPRFRVRDLGRQINKDIVLIYEREIPHTGYSNHVLFPMRNAVRLEREIIHRFSYLRFSPKGDIPLPSKSEWFHNFALLPICSFLERHPMKFKEKITINNGKRVLFYELQTTAA